MYFYQFMDLRMIMFTEGNAIFLLICLIKEDRYLSLELLIC